MFKKLTAAVLAAAMLFSISAFAAEETPENNLKSGVKFDFAQDDAGFVPIFADYPAGEDADEFYELDSGRKEIPVENEGMGLYLSGNNHSDDLFMGYYKNLSGFEPNKTYAFDISFSVATNADGGMMGIGGSPGASVYVKCGVTTNKPAIYVNDQNGRRLNVDKGNQAQSGKDVQTIGTIQKEETLLPGKYEMNRYTASAEAAADKDGNVYLLIGTDSGFEGTTSYYISEVSLSWEKKADPACDAAYLQAVKDAKKEGIIESYDMDWKEEMTRVRFCELVYTMLSKVKELPVAKLAENPFDDVMNPAVNGLAFLGIVSGRGEKTFAPDDKITREEAAVILYRAADYAGAELPEAKADEEYADMQEAASWAKAPVCSLKVLEIMSGNGDDFYPKGTYTCEESVFSVMKMYRFLNK